MKTSPMTVTRNGRKLEAVRYRDDEGRQLGVAFKHRGFWTLLRGGEVFAELLLDENEVSTILSQAHDAEQLPPSAALVDHSVEGSSEAWRARQLAAIGIRRNGDEVDGDADNNSDGDGDGDESSGAWRARQLAALGRPGR